MNRKPYFQFYVKDYLADTSDLEDSDHGLYLRILCYLWLENGEMEVELLRKKLKISSKKFEKKLKKIEKFFFFSEKKPTKISQKRLLAEYSKYQKICEKNSEIAILRENKKKENSTLRETDRITKKARPFKPETRNQKPERKDPPLHPPLIADDEPAEMIALWKKILDLFNLQNGMPSEVQKCRMVAEELKTRKASLNQLQNAFDAISEQGWGSFSPKAITKHWTDAIQGFPRSRKTSNKTQEVRALIEGARGFV